MKSNEPETGNPFTVQTPEDISAADMDSLFVDVFTDFYSIPRVGHTFLHGPRGSGKSMMFRYLEPDCQCIARHETVPELPFFGVYVSIKNTDLKLTELMRLENKHANLVLNEHFLVLHIAIKFLSSLIKADVPGASEPCPKEVRDYHASGFSKLLKASGWQDSLPALPQAARLKDWFLLVRDIFAEQHSTLLSYLRKLSFVDSPVPYPGPLCGYLDFLLSFMQQVKSFAFMPRGPIFLLLDDADNLNYTQTSLINSWVASRTQANVSLKISTQMNYKTFLTATGQTIDSPHDFSEIHISAVYTSSKNKYLERVREIVSRRLKMHKINKPPEEFFPEYEKQEEAIREIGRRLRERWRSEGRGYRPSDDAARYARPEYIASLQGPAKSGPTYKYAGFKQLVHVSSGIVRYFLEPASLMYAAMRADHRGAVVDCIDPDVQDRVAREQANAFLFSEFDRWSTDESDDAQTLDVTKKLRNLIIALGGTFHEILMSNASERRVFSVAFSEDPDPDVLDVFKLGVRYGYFHESTIGNKEGTGRTRLFILSRRLAPVFTLDPTSFAGYKFATNNILREAMQKPKTFVGKIRRKGVEAVFESPQLGLFQQEEPE
jgi:hypothetical protein